MTSKDEVTGLETVYLARYFDTALEFLNALSPWAAEWQNTGGIEHWLFRGQSDASWRLTPSAMRKDAFPSWNMGSAGLRYSPNPGDQEGAETRAVQRFLEACDKSAVPIPEDGQWLRSDAMDSVWVTEEANTFPPQLQLSLFALAQHHGVPTRLLDWSRLPLVAAYFACREAARAAASGEPTPSTTNRCAVFALRTPIAFSRLAERAEPRLLEVTAPFDANPNLRAQRGAFTLVAYRKQPALSEVLPTIEELIAAWVSEGVEAKAPPTTEHLMLVKYTLPHSECRRLLRLLAQANVHAATVFPDYDGAVRSLYEREWHI